ncbi:MAG TPA: glyoxalase superfamily protein [Povalibacter sp.]|nr:glyoxalase superfamily protein [Povalibacter sp.]
MIIRRIDVVSVPVSDQLASKAFYSDVLGFEVIRDNPMGPDQRWVQLALPGAQTSITLVTWFDSMPPGSLQGMVVDTTDIDAARKTLVGKGLRITEVQDAPWGRYATFADPDGNGWVLKQAVV